MRPLLAALILTTAAQAQTAPPASTPSPAQTTTPAAQPGAPANQAPSPATLAAAADAPPPPTIDTLGPLPPPPYAQQLVSGAPLHDPNVAVHVVEKKDFADQGHQELVAYPIAPQFNGKFTQHDGTAFSYLYHLQERLALRAMGQWNWYAHESAFNEELVEKVHEEAQAATSLLLQWGAVGGVEVSPLYGKFAFYDSLAHFSVVLDAGAGLGKTRHQLKPNNDAGPATYGDTGNRFVGDLGGGFRFQFGEHFSVRMEVHDMVYTARVDRVNGCSLGDLNSLENARTAGQSLDSAGVSGGCNVKAFSGTDSANRPRADDIPLAMTLVNSPTSDVVNNVAFYAGIGLVF
jgi:outer membrane beta-barrel protein